jgi:SAM-dependent methyltransferase
VLTVDFDRLGLRPGERLLDMGAGGGRHAFEAYRRGADVIAFDQDAEELAKVREWFAAMKQADEVPAGAEADVKEGDALALPFGDGEFDRIIAAEVLEHIPADIQAIAELVRVLRPGGRAFVTAWLPEGASHEVAAIAMRAVAEATGRPAAPPFGWHDADRLAQLAAEHGVTVDSEDAEISFTAGSLEAYVAEGLEHPMQVASRPLLERAGTYDAVGAQILETLRANNEDPAAFRTTSRYRIHRIERPA